MHGPIWGVLSLRLRDCPYSEIWPRHNPGVFLQENRAASDEVEVVRRAGSVEQNRNTSMESCATSKTCDSFPALIPTWETFVHAVGWLVIRSRKEGQLIRGRALCGESPQLLFLSLVGE